MPTRFDTLRRDSAGAHRTTFLHFRFPFRSLQKLLACAVVWGALAGQLAWADPWDAQRKAAKKFKPGDKVEVQHHGEKVRGVVTSVDRFGRVRVASPKFENGWPYDPAEVGKLVSRKPTNKAGSGGSDANPFATEDEKFQAIGKRTWTDRSGKFRIEASVVRIDGDKVVLQRADNKEIAVVRSKLSDEDQAILDKSLGDAPAEEPSPGDGDDDLVAETDPNLEPDIQVTEVDLSAATPMDFGAANEWKYQPDPRVSPVKPARIALPARRDFFDHVETLLLPANDKAYIVVVNRHDKNMPPRIQACDLTTRKLAGQGDFYPRQMPLDVSPDGKKLLARSNIFGFGNNNRIFLYSLDGSKTKPLASWIPQPGERGGSHDIQWAQFVDADHVFTLNQSGQLTLWKVSSGVAPVYTAQVAGRSTPAFSGGRRFLIARTKSGIAIVNALSGEPVGFLPAPGEALNDCLALRPDGRRLALTDGGRIRVWNLDSQELERDFSLLPGLHAQSLAWCDDARLVTNHGDLVDVDRRVRLWKYQGISTPVGASGEGVWTVIEGRTNDSSLLVGVKLPHGDAIRAAEQLNPESLLVIRPGLDVSLKMDFAAAPAERARVEKALSQRLEEAGMHVVPQASVQLVAAIKQGPAQKVEFQRFGTLKSSTHSAPQQKLTLAYLIDGKPVWTHENASWTPHMLRLEENETIDQALAREMRLDPKAFESIFVPAYVAASPEGGSYGQSSWPGAD